MAWTEKTPSGRVRGCYRTAEGKKRYKTFDHAKAAKRWAEAEEQKVVDGSRRDPARGRMKWSTWADQWWPSRQLEPGALRSQTSLREHYVEPRWGDVPLNEIDHLSVQTWVNGLTPHLSASSAQQAYYQLSASLKAAVRAGLLDASPCYGIRLPRRPPAPERYLSDAELGAVLHHMDGVYRVLVEVLVETGMRIGEAVVLHEHRIDWDARTIDVIEKWDQYEKVIRAYPKGKKRRTVPLTDHLAEVLAAWLADVPVYTGCGFAHEKGSLCRSALVMVGPRGAVIDPHNFTNVKWSDAIDRAGIGHARPHDLRHTYASRLITGGVSIARLQKLLGHDSITTTERYAHLISEGHDEVRDALARHNRGAPQGADRLPNLDSARQRRDRRMGGSPAQNPQSNTP